VDSADYIRIVSEPDSGSALFNVKEYYRLSKKIKSVGKSSRIDPPMYEGQYIAFYESGKREVTETYKNGVKIGLNCGFFPNGKLYMVKKYPEVIKENSVYLNEFSVIASYDSLGKALVVDSNGYCIEYKDDFKKVAAEGTILNGKKDGVWKGDAPGHILFTEKYNNGTLVSGTSTDTLGLTMNYEGASSVPPSFPGGLAAFGKYLGNTIRFPEYEREHNIQGKVIVKFIVEKDGTVSEVRTLNTVSKNIDKEAARVINRSPKWIAGKQYGRNVRVSYTVPIAFVLGPPVR
jgi:TonB family protein